MVCTVRLLCEALHCHGSRYFFRLVTPAFVLNVFFDLFQQVTVVGTVHKASQEMKL